MANLLFSVDTEHLPANHKSTKRPCLTQIEKVKEFSFLPTFKVKEYKVHLFFLIEVNLLRYSEFEESSVLGPDVDHNWMRLCQFANLKKIYMFIFYELIVTRKQPREYSIMIFLYFVSPYWAWKDDFFLVTYQNFGLLTDPCKTWRGFRPLKYNISCYLVHLSHFILTTCYHFSFCQLFILTT